MSINNSRLIEILSCQRWKGYPLPLRCRYHRSSKESFAVNTWMGNIWRKKLSIKLENGLMGKGDEYYGVNFYEGSQFLCIQRIDLFKRVTMFIFCCR